MNLLHCIRHWAAGLSGRAILAWLFLSITAASAAPLVHPQSMELVCSAAGEVRLIVKTQDGGHALGTSHWDCAACLPFSAPPAAAVVVPPPPAAIVAELPVARLTAHVPDIQTGPLPARGPPRS